MSPDSRGAVEAGINGFDRPAAAPGWSVAVVADCFYGDNEAFTAHLHRAHLPYVLALKPHKGTWAPADAPHTPVDAARTLTFTDPEHPGHWTPVVRTFRDGHTQRWWAAEASLGPWGPDRPTRLVAATTDPATLPKKNTWYLITNLPGPSAPHAAPSPHRQADLAEVVRLYGLRSWVEQSYQQVKDELGWADFQVRSAEAILPPASGRGDPQPPDPGHLSVLLLLGQHPDPAPRS